jgi:hypothetical protein
LNRLGSARSNPGSAVSHPNARPAVREEEPAQTKDPFPAYVHALQPEPLKSCFASLRIERYEEVTELGHWGGPPARLLRMVAYKP